MKRLTSKLLLFPILLSALGLKAQVEFAPIGAEWHYEYNNFWNVGYVSIKSVSDTIIDSTDCRKLVKTGKIYDYNTKETREYVFGHEYMTQINDSVMIYRYGKLRKLYDLNAKIGDTITFPGSEQEPVYDSTLMYGKAVVTDKGFVEFAGVSLKYIDIKNLYDEYGYMTPWGFSGYGYDDNGQLVVRICERIGNLGYLLPGIFYYADYYEGGALRCYSDNAISISFTDKDCDYVPGTESLEEMSLSDIVKVCPNPTEDCLNIEFAEENNHIEIYDNIGKKISSLQTNDKSVNINMSEYPSGLYLVVIKNDKGNCFKRIVKN